MNNLARILKNKKNVITIIGNEFLYFRGFSGNYSLMMDNQKKYSCVVLIAKYNNEIESPNIYLHNEPGTFVSSKSDQNLIIRMPNHSNYKINVGPIYYPICEIMKDTRSTLDPALNVEAVVNLIKARREDYHQSKELNRILCQIKNHSLEGDFNLDSLCGNVYMSRRKVQYLLKEHGMCFRDVLAKNRLSNVARLVAKNSKICLEELALQSGFSTLCSANKTVFKFKGVNLRVYKENIKMWLETTTD